MEQDTATTGGDGAFAPTPLGDILRDDAPQTEREPAGRQEPLPTEAAPIETGDAPADLTKDTRPRDEQGRFAPKEEKPAETGPPPAEQSAPQTVPVGAVLEERKKRQALEVRLREMEARLAAPPPPAAAPQQQAAPEVPLEDLMFQDPQRFIERVRQPLEDQIVQTRVAMSEQLARQKPDYAEAEAAFLAWVEANPAERSRVVQEMRSQASPAEWAADVGRQIVAQQRWGQVIQQYGSPEAYLAAQQQAAPPVAHAPVAQPSAPPTPPGSLASVRSAGPRSGAAPWTGPTPLSAILGRR